MKKIPAMTFGQLMNTLYIKTKVYLRDEDGCIGFCKMDKIPSDYNDYIVIGIWADGEDMIGIKIVKE